MLTECISVVLYPAIFDPDKISVRAVLPPPPVSAVTVWDPLVTLYI